MATLLRTWFCILVFTCFLYSVIDHQNDLTAIRRELPILLREVKAVEEENIRLQYQIDCFESPTHLMELAEQPQFKSLQFPYQTDLLLVEVPKAQS